MIIWPRLSRAVASSEWERIRDEKAAAGQSLIRDVQWRAIGNRADESDFGRLHEQVTELATTHGFPESAGADTYGRFDREAAFLVRDLVDVPFAEAAAGDVWSFIAFAVLPEVTEWRFGHRNKERWIGTDLTRHTWARLWWQGEAFRPEPELLTHLSESDLNQLFERRSIGGDGPLVRALARSFMMVTAERRAIVRDTTKRIRRLLAFVQTSALESEEIGSLADEIVELSTELITGRSASESNDRRNPSGAGSVAVVSEEEVPERSLGLMEPTYLAYHRPAALSATQLLEPSALENMIQGAVEVEGPVLQSRLRRLVAGAVEDDTVLSSADAAISSAIDALLQAARIEADDFELSGLGSQRSLRVVGSPAVRVRPLGARRLLEVPLREALAIAQLAPEGTATSRMEYLLNFYGLEDLDVLDRMVLLQLANA
jgi:hypothetical protein